ncbi:MAG TPA: fibronectin type III domain-containing protein [Solirubrobacteraceae bacterium]
MLAALIVLVCAATAQAATIVVNTTSDAAPTDNECSGTAGDCSLRQAVDKASPGDTIELGSGDYALTLGTDIEITKSLLIEGAGVSSTSIDGSQNRGSNQYGETARIFRTDSEADVTIEDLTFTGGDDGTDEVPCNACDTDQLNGGGALWNDGATVVINDVAFTNNSGSPVGGAISASGGTLTLTDDSFTDDGAGIGGALFTHPGSTTVIANGDTFDSDGDLGAIYMFGGNVTLTNSTEVNSGASNEIGGGLRNGGGTLTLVNDTLSGNVRGQLMTDQGATTNVENTIIANGFSEGDGDCVAPGEPDDVDGATSAAAITNDLGYNIDQDNSCGLDGTGDSSNIDPMLVPIADNGGPTQTQALIQGSPALGDPATTACPTQDQRGVTRPSGMCDIGAFEAVLHGEPDATTGDASNVTDTSADLAATINLDGEAGGFHFRYGTSSDDLSSSSPEAAAGVVSSETAETETLSNLNPGTTYYYLAAADNSTASVTASTPGQFTTQADAPNISNVDVASVTDTTATIDFSIDPEGADTTYYVEYGPDTNYGQQTQPIDIGSTPGPQDLSVTLTELNPGSSYDAQIVATNSVDPDGVGSGDQQFDTDQQVTGTAGDQVQLTDYGSDDGDCPTGANTTVDWGDDFSDTNAQIECDDGTWSTSDTHTYGAPGHYMIQIEYGEFGTITQYAEISPNDSGISNTALPTISGTAEQDQTLTATEGSWDGSPSTFDYQWLDCDESGNNCTPTGDDNPNYTLTGDDVGDTIRVIVNATSDGEGTTATSDQTDVVQQIQPPSNDESPAITGIAQQGQTLTTSTGTWENNPGSFDYQWQDCDSSGQNCTNTGTDADTYALGASDVGHTVQVIVTATNDSGQGQATSNLTAKVLAPNSPPSSPPAANPSLPTVATTTPTVSMTSAGFSGSVTPNGLPTQAYFEYGLDPRYTGGGEIQYTQSTTAQSVGSGFASQAIGPVSVAGLLPNALYHVRLVATNTDGTTFGPDVTFTTVAAPAPSPPTVGQTVNLAPVSGIVLIKINGKFVPLTGLDQIPTGSQIDARHGSLELITSNGEKGKTQHGTFGGAIFKLTQTRSGASKGLVTLSIVENAFKGAPSYALCTKHPAGEARAAALSSKTLQLLHASGHGKFRTSGRYSAATVRGTIWTIADRCDGTLVHDVTDSVSVTDFVHHKTIILHAGQSYLARAP